VHIACGVKTNVVTAVRILDKDAADCPQFIPLMKTTGQRFAVSEASADKAYLSGENIEAIFEQGGTPFIMPKSNTTGGMGGLFEKMFHYFQYRREEFLSHYHKRSNVESTFSAIKRKFGDAIRSKTDVAMVNEVLGKILCHNLCCLIQRAMRAWHRAGILDTPISSENHTSIGMWDYIKPALVPFACFGNRKDSDQKFLSGVPGNPARMRMTSHELEPQISAWRAGSCRRQGGSRGPTRLVGWRNLSQVDKHVNRLLVIRRDFPNIVRRLAVCRL
jgi:hypothetical protein